MSTIGAFFIIRAYFTKTRRAFIILWDIDCLEFFNIAFFFRFVITNHFALNVFNHVLRYITVLV